MKKHNYGVEKIADLYLGELFKIKDKYTVQNGQPHYKLESDLDLFLDDPNVFYNHKLSMETKEKGLLGIEKAFYVVRRGRKEGQARPRQD